MLMVILKMKNKHKHNQRTVSESLSDDLYRDIPHEYYDGDVTKSGRLSPEEVKKLADCLLKEGFSKLRQKYHIEHRG